MTRWKDTLPPLVVTPELSAAAFHLVAALRDTTGGFRDYHSLIAAAHIRAVRKQIEAEHGISSDRVGDWSAGESDERILWGALYYVAQSVYFGDHAVWAVDCLRAAEAGLRTLWKRGQA